MSKTDSGRSKIAFITYINQDATGVKVWPSTFRRDRLLICN